MNNEQKIALYQKVWNREAELIKKTYVNNGVLTEKHFIEGKLVEEFTRSYPKDLVLTSDYMPDETRIQIENWKNSFSIGAYPVAKNDGIAHKLFGVYPAKGETFRCSYDFSTLEEAAEIFEKLKTGLLGLKDITDKFNIIGMSKETLAKCLGYQSI